MTGIYAPPAAQPIVVRYTAPYLLAPSGTFSDTSGAFTLGTALTVVPNGATPGGGNCWMYLPAGAGGLAAGWREAFFATASAGYLIGLPATTATAWTGATGAIPLPPISIPGGALGPNGNALLLLIGRNNNSAGTKTFRGGVGGASSGLWNLSSTTVTGLRSMPIIQCRGATNKQIGGPESGQIGSGPIAAYMAVDTAAPWLITPSLQCAAVTDWAMYDFLSVTCSYAGDA